MPDHVRMFRALISVSDKTRLVEFARALARHGVELVSTGGTRKALALRRKLAAKAYARTAVYDAAISGWFAQQLDEAAPPYRAVGGSVIERLRYGENPHQSAAFYRTAEVRPGVATARQVQGKQL